MKDRLRTLSIRLRHWPRRLGRSFRLHPIRNSLVTVAVLSLAGAWVALAYQPPLNAMDPVVVADTFVAELQAKHPNRAYQLTSEKYRKSISYDIFTSSVIPSISQDWPASQPKLTTQAAPPDGNKNMLQIIFDLPSDGQADAYTAAILVIRANPDSPWQVEGITSVPDSELTPTDKTAPAKQ